VRTTKRTITCDWCGLSLELKKEDLFLAPEWARINTTIHTDSDSSTSNDEDLCGPCFDRRKDVLVQVECDSAATRRNKR
jgi:hypothetical protein